MNIKVTKNKHSSETFFSDSWNKISIKFSSEEFESLLSSALGKDTKFYGVATSMQKSVF